MDSVIAISAGCQHSLALGQDGTAWAWGWDIMKPDVVDIQVNLSIPKQVSGLTTNVVLIAAGYIHDVFLDDEDTVWLRSPSGLSRMSLPEVVGISAGFRHSLALRQDGTVWAWGSNQYGQLGNDQFEEQAIPLRVSGLEEIIAISAGWFHNLALRQDGSLWTWGWNYESQLGGASDSEIQSLPTLIRGLPTIVLISAGHYHSVVAGSDGTIWTWGSYDDEKLFEDDRVTPVIVPNLPDGVAKIAAGGGHSLVLAKDGSIWCWGQNREGQLGIGSTIDSYVPRVIRKLKNIIDISAGGFHNIAIAQDGSLWAWGENFYGQLGVDINDDFSSWPLQVTGGRS